jgi:hypothetical protein
VIDDQPTLLVGGQPGVTGAATYTIGTKQSPSVDANQRGYCGSGAIEECALANTAAFFPLENSSGDFDSCFAYAWGRIDDAANTGVVVRCTDGSDATLPVPRDARERRDNDFEDDNVHQPQWLASDSAERPLLLVGLPNQNAAWFYAPEQTSPQSLTLPGDADAPESFGGQVAVLLIDEEADVRLLAVSAPEEGQVWLFRPGEEESAPAVGCLGTYESFGRTLAAGDVDGDGADDLVVADQETVTAFSGARLAEFGQAYGTSCSLDALPEGALLASFSCGSADDIGGCSRSDFGAALAVGDLDGDDDGEILVGAPRMQVFGRERAGAVLVYDAEGDDPHELSDQLYVASAEAGDGLGTAVAAIPQKGRDIVAAGGPANDKVHVFYCTDLLAGRDRTGRCGF